MNDLLLVMKSVGLGREASLERPRWLRTVWWITPLGRCMRVRVYIPSVDRSGRRIRRGPVRAAVENLLLTIAGGCNLTNATGVWRSGVGTILRERIGVGDAYVQVGVPPRVLNNFLLGLRMLAVEWAQDAILVVIDGWPLLISGSPAQSPRRLESATPSDPRTSGGER